MKRSWKIKKDKKEKYKLLGASVPVSLFEKISLYALSKGQGKSEVMRKALESYTIVMPGRSLLESKLAENLHQEFLKRDMELPAFVNEITPKLQKFGISEESQTKVIILLKNKCYEAEA
jgi:hypothetical protein